MKLCFRKRSPQLADLRLRSVTWRRLHNAIPTSRVKLWNIISNYSIPLCIWVRRWRVLRSCRKASVYWWATLLPHDSSLEGQTKAACLVDILRSETRLCRNLILKLPKLVTKSKLCHLEMLQSLSDGFGWNQASTACWLLVRTALVNIISPYQNPGFTTWRSTACKKWTP